MKQGRILAVVFLSVFLDLLGFGIIIPVQPFYAETLGASPTLVTLLGSSFSLTQFLFAPFWGRLSDRVGRRPIMLVSIAVSAVGYAVFGSAQTLWLLFVARMTAGFGAANIGTAQAIVADSTGAQGRAKGMGLIGAAFGLGFTLGPAVGGYFARFGLGAPAYVAAGLAVVNWVLAYFLLPETYPGRGKSTGRGHGAALSWEALSRAARHPHVATLFAIYFVFTTGFSLMEQVMALFIESAWVHGLGLAPAAAMKEAAERTAYVLIVVGVTAIIIQGGLVGRWARTYGEGALLKVGTALAGLGLLLVPATGAGPFPYILGVSVLLAAGSGLTTPSLSSYLSQSVGPEEQGGTLGLAQSLSSLGRVVGPAAAGWLFEWNRGLPFWVGAALMALCVGVALRLPRRARLPVAG